MADHKKEVIVEKLKEQLSSAKGSVFTTYKGLRTKCYIATTLRTI